MVGYYVAPLAMESLLETPYWTKKGPLEHELPRDNLVKSLHELSIHGKEVYDKWAPRMLKAA